MNICSVLIQETNFRARTIDTIERIVKGTVHVFIDKKYDRAQVSILGPLQEKFVYYENDLSYKLSYGLIDADLLAKNAVCAYERWIFRNIYN